MGSHLEDSIKKNRIKVSKITDVNDAFEYHHTIREDYSDSELIQYTKKLMSRKHPLMQSLISKIINDPKMRDQFLKRMRLDQVSFTEYYPETLKRINKTCRILSLSKDTNNHDILMWGHYSNNHKGTRFFMETGICWRLAANKIDIDYTESPQELDTIELSLHSFHKPNNDYSKYFINRKSTHWKYEEEVRSLIRNKDCFTDPENINKDIEYTKLQTEGITRIDFGIRYSERDTSIDQSSVSQFIVLYQEKLHPEIQFTQAERNPHDYKIDYKEIDKEKTIEKGEVVYTGNIL
jgi:hypothetical protein